MKRLALIIASLAAFAACAVPASASALVWGPAGSSTALDASGTLYNVPSAGFGWTCGGEHMVGKVRNPAASTLDISGATYSSCTGTGSSASGCVAKLTAASLPWTIQGLSTTNVTFNVGKVNVELAGTCAWNGLTFNFSGALAGGTWNSTTHSIAYSGDVGLKIHGLSVFENLSVTVTGSYRDPAQALTLS